MSDQTTPEPEQPDQPTDAQIVHASQLVQAAARRLDAQGLVDHDETGTWSMSSDAIRTMFDLLTLWNIHTQNPGQDLPPTWQLAHDAGLILHQALVAILFADESPEGARDAYRQAVTALRHASRNHRY